MFKRLCLMALCLSGAAANAQLFDSTWATNGYTQNPNFRDESLCMAIQPDGKVVAGLNQGQNQNGFSDLYTCRFNANGTLDSSYGTNGIGKVWIGEKAKTRDVDLQPDGKIVAIGHAEYCVDIICGLDNLVLARYKSNGQPDSSFGVNGKVLSEYVFGNTVMSAIGMRVKVLPGGKILASGTYIFQSAVWGTERHAFVAKFNSDGTLDNSFGTGGKTVLGQYSTTAPYYDNLEDMVVDNAGNIYCTGTAFHPGTSLTNLGDAYVMKLTPNGIPDNGFGNGGELLLDKSPRDDPHALAIRADGKLYVAGSSGEPDLDSPRHGIIYVVNSSDGTYAGDIPGGYKVIDVGTNFASEILSMILQSDNKIVISGIADSAGWGGMGLVARFNADASNDLSFAGTSNKAFYKLSSNPSWTTPLYRIRQQPDGKLLVAGHKTIQGYGPTVLVMRIKPGNVVLPNGIAGAAAASILNATVFPNPLTDQSTVRFILPYADEVRMRLIDLSGKTVVNYRSGERLSAGKQSIALGDISSLTKGIYTLELQTAAGMRWVAKLSLQ